MASSMRKRPDHLNQEMQADADSLVVVQFEMRSGEFISPHGGIEPPLHQTVPLPIP
jgi:hypothetical protein